MNQKKTRKRIELSRETLRHVRGGGELYTSYLWCTNAGQCESKPPKCPSNWITHCPINGTTGITCIQYTCVVY